MTEKLPGKLNIPDELKQKMNAYFDQAVCQVHILVNNYSGPHGGYFGA